MRRSAVAVAVAGRAAGRRSRRPSLLDLYYCLDWAFQEAEQAGLPLPGEIDANAIGQRRWALEWAVVFRGPVPRRSRPAGKRSTSRSSLRPVRRPDRDRRGRPCTAVSGAAASRPARRAGRSGVMPIRVRRLARRSSPACGRSVAARDQREVRRPALAATRAGLVRVDAEQAVRLDQLAQVVGGRRDHQQHAVRGAAPGGTRRRCGARRRSGAPRRVVGQRQRPPQVGQDRAGPRVGPGGPAQGRLGDVEPSPTARRQRRPGRRAR